MVQEKVDGSQISFGTIDGELHMRSKGAIIDIDAPDKMFGGAVETVTKVQVLLSAGYTYRGEVLSKPKHNALAYNRVPAGNIVLFDVDRGQEDYSDPAAVAFVASVLGVEAVPTLFVGKIDSLEQVTDLLDRESFLGGQKIEGVVIKNYHRFGVDKKALMGKLVSEAFKEVRSRKGRFGNPSKADVIAVLTETLRTEARWQKAVQHLRESGQLTDSPADIGPLILEVVADVRVEQEEWIADQLFNHFWKDISRGLARGLPEWYKRQLAERQFSGGREGSTAR